MTPVFVGYMTRSEELTAPWFKEDCDDVRLSIQGQERRLVELIDLLKALSLEKPGRYPCQFAVALRRREQSQQPAPRSD